MKYFQPFQILYTLLIFIGGIIGFITAKSNASIIMGSIFTLFFLFTISLSSKKAELSFLISFILTSILFCFFGFRFYSTLSILPAGLMSLISFIFLIFHTQLFRKKNYLFKFK